MDKERKADVHRPLSRLGNVYATIRQHGDAVTTEKTTEKILSLILENPNITTEELARVCDMTPDGVYYHTKRLREKGVLIREGGRKEGHWVVVKKSWFRFICRQKHFIKVQGLQKY